MLRLAVKSMESIVPALPHLLRHTLPGLLSPAQVMFDRPGHVHKRFNKSKSALFRLSAKRVMRPAYAKVVRRLGFKTRSLS